MEVSTSVENEHNQKHLTNEDEERHFREILNAFRYYRCHSLKRVLVAENNFNELPKRHRALLPDFLDNLKKLRTCVLHNYEILKLIVVNTNHIFENADHHSNLEESIWPSTESNMEKVRVTLKQCVRDWTSLGAAEREVCYKPVVDEICTRFPSSHYTKSKVNILVPGAGLGRLAFEIARQGYSCQGNEFSLFMIFTSNFILNRCMKPDLLTIYPWIHQYCNNLLTEDQLSGVTFPDINPADLNSDANFSMAAGDFMEVYTQPDYWDCIATVFFIDTAHNILAYIEKIYEILQPGGIWINFGPLLYHFAEVANEKSIELSYEDLRKVILQFKFDILKEETDIACDYIQNPTSMLRYQYKCVFFVARKPLNEHSVPKITNSNGFQ